MSIFIMAMKAILLAVLALVAFSALMMVMGYEPAAAREAALCTAQPVPSCLFTIL